MGFQEEYRIKEDGLGVEKKGTAEIIDFPKKREEKNEQELLEKIEQERKEAKERFGGLIDSVSRRYDKLPEDEKRNYILHKEETLDAVIELGIKKGFSKEELEESELGAILHDMTKADDAPEEYKDVPNYALAMHAKTAAEEVPNILTDEYLKGLNIQGDPEAIRQEVAKAILEHMGPRPGFMVGILDKFNKDMESRGGKGVDYPYASGKISEALLAADMKSLAGKKGIKKVLSDRANKEFFAEQDRDLAEEYKKYGIDLSQREVALLSGFDSAKQARDMQKDEKNREWVNQSLEESKKAEYDFPGLEKTISWEEADAKRRQYEEAKKLEEVRDKLKAAA